MSRHVIAQVRAVKMPSFTPMASCGLCKPRYFNIIYDDRFKRACSASGPWTAENSHVLDSVLVKPDGGFARPDKPTPIERQDVDRWVY